MCAMWVTRLGVAIAVFAIAQQATNPAPQQSPTFRTGVALTTIDVTVLDADGKPVPGLTAADLEIKLDGKVQPIRALAYVQAAQPGAPAATAPAPAVPAPPVAAAQFSDGARRTFTNAGALAAPPAETAKPAAPSSPPAESRTFILLIDDLSFPPGAGRRMLAAAQRFVDRVPASDPIGFTTTTGIGAVNPTRDRAVIRAALVKVVGQFSDPRGIQKTGPTGAGRTRGTDSPLGISQSLDIDRGDDRALADAIILECFDGVRSALNGLSIAQVIAENQCASDVRREARQIAGLTRQNKGRQLEGVRSVIRAMNAAGGIRHIVLLSDGLPVSREVDDLHPLVRAAAAAGVQLSVLMQDPDISVTDDARGESMNAPDRTQTDTGMSARRREDNALHLSGLQTMTDMLGGTFYRLIGDVDSAFDRVLIASAAVYRLGVELPAGGKPGDFFDVSVSVKRPGLKARANRFSVAAAPAAAETAPAAASAPAPSAPVVAASIDDTLKSALSANKAANSVPIRIAAYVRRSASAEGQIDVAVDAAIPASVSGPLTTFIGVVDAKGALRSSRRVLNPSDGADYATSFLFPLPPGDYRVRYAVADAARALGTIELPVRAALAPLGGFTASDVLTWYVDPYSNSAQLFALEDVPQGIAVLRASLELYPASATEERPLIRWTLTREGEPAPLQQSEVQPEARNGMYRADAEFAIEQIPPGRYEIRANLISNGNVAGWRAAIVRK